MKYKLHTLVGALALAASGASLAQNTAVNPGQTTMTPASPTGRTGDTEACAKLSARERIDCIDQAARDRGASPPSHRTDSPPMDSSGNKAGTQSDPSGMSSGTRRLPPADAGGTRDSTPHSGTGSSSSTK